MIRTIGLSAFLSILAISGFAQDDTAEDSGNGRLSSHYISIQANQLFRQLFSLSSSSSAVNNPYLVTYTVTSNASGVGLSIGLGYTFNEFQDGDGATKRETKINDLFFRIGFEKKSNLGKRWILGAGGDFVIDNQSNTTTSSNFGGFFNKIEDKTSGWGLGPRVSLSFRISERVLVGTEANYYFKSLRNTDSTFDGATTNSEVTDLKQFQLNVPAVLFLTLKL